jgi:Arc/MetJ family transcription regulator
MDPLTPTRMGEGARSLPARIRGCILICMRTTLILRDELIERAAAMTGIREKTALVHAGLEALIAREAARRLAALGGSDPRASAPRRRRPGSSR